MDKYYGNVCELDIIFNFQKAYFILDELLLAGEMQESSKKNVLRCISQEDSLEDMEVSILSIWSANMPLPLPDFARLLSTFKSLLRLIPVRPIFRLRKRSPNSCSLINGVRKLPTLF